MSREPFIRAATWHGPLDEAEAQLAKEPELPFGDIHVAAILGDYPQVRELLAADPALALRTAPPYGGTALVYLCLSKYLRRGPTADFIRAATALLDAGADPNAGFTAGDDRGDFETALYGAAGVAHNADLTRLLIERGADPTDGEVVYHSPESDDLGALKVIVETGRLSPVDLSLMLIRKHDWHDPDGVKYLLEHGADPNVPWGNLFPIHQAVKRDNGPKMIAMLLDHGADPYRQTDGLTAIARAAREGRRDLLELFAARGFDTTLTGVDGFIKDCVMGKPVAANDALKALGGTLLTRFAGSGNVKGIEALLDSGIDVNTPFMEGDLYFGIPPGSLPIHVAAWKAYAGTVPLLLARGAAVDIPDANGQTPLLLAVKAATQSYWTWRRTTEGIDALLMAGAALKGVKYPTGYEEADRIIATYDTAI